jgi:hypothetical protein
MFRHKYAFFGAGCLLAATIACSNTGNPVSPNAALPGSGAAGPNGETLKIAAPATVSPTGGARSDIGLVLVVGNVSGQYASFPVSYRYEIRNAAGSTVASGTQAGSSGSQTSISVTNASLAFDADHTWRVRAERGSAFGPWSAAASFKTPAGSYFQGSEVLDLLNDGKTVGQVRGNVSFTSDGARMNDGTGYIAYQLPQFLQEGEFSFMATNVDEGNVADKAKVMSMSEGCHVNMTDNDYRTTLEVRGSIYPNPGAVQMRQITGDAREEFHRIADSQRFVVAWSRSEWYFFKIFWRVGIAGFEIRTGGPTGPIHHALTFATSGHPYRPVPHCVLVGSSPVRAGIQDQTHPGMIAKQVWISGNARPAFPAIIGIGK